MAAVERRGAVVLGVLGRLYGCFFARGVESGGDPYPGAGDSTVVFVAGGGFVEGALSEAGCEGDQQAVGVTLGLLPAPSLDTGDGGCPGVH